MQIWDSKRCDELRTFLRLLQEIAAINNGSGCLERIKTCIDLANSLRSYDYEELRPSFSDFLQDICNADRKQS